MRRLVGFGCALALLAAAPSSTFADGRVWVKVGDPGRLSCGVAPTGWQRAEFDDRGWVERPIVFERHDLSAPAAAVPGETSAPFSSLSAAGGRPVDSGNASLVGQPKTMNGQPIAASRSASPQPGSTNRPTSQQTSPTNRSAGSQPTVASGASSSQTQPTNGSPNPQARTLLPQQVPDVVGTKAPAGPSRAAEAPASQSRSAAGSQVGSPPVGVRQPTFPADQAAASGQAGGGAGASSCSAARFVRLHFAVDTAALAGLRALTLRVRYTHGFAAYIDGVEVARRRLDPAAAPDGLANDVHGLEFESFTIPARGQLHAGDNVLAVEVHPHTAGRPTALELSLSGDDHPRIIRGPYLLGVFETEATVVVDTDLPTTAALTWGPRADSAAAVTDGLSVHHVLKLTKLKPGAMYHYRVRVRAPENMQTHNLNVQTRNETGQAHSDDLAAPVERSAQPVVNMQMHNKNVQTHNEGQLANDEAAELHDENVRLHNENVQSHHERQRQRREAESDWGSDATTDSGDSVFHTPPEAGRPLRFAVYGDVRSGHDVHAALNRSLLDEQPDLAILTGDLVDRGTDEGEWESFFDVAGPLIRQICIFPAVGNHEYAKQGRGIASFMQLFRWPIAAVEESSWYSYEVSGAHFVALDSDQYKSPRQLGWFEHDLREARRRRVRAIFVYAHEGPASSGLHGDNQICVRDYVPIMQRYHVSMFFGGHDHDYERGRTGTLDYVVTGGGGAELRAARCGVPGKRACPARCAIFVNDHNYVMVELLPSLFRVCAKRVDGTPIEACVQYPLRP